MPNRRFDRLKPNIKTARFDREKCDKYERKELFTKTLSERKTESVNIIFFFYGCSCDGGSSGTKSTGSPAAHTV